jgi:hypothetical protein
VAAAGKSHELPFYVCTGTVQCPGCFDGGVGAADALLERPAVTAGRTPARGAHPERATASAVAPAARPALTTPEPPAPKVVFGAAWSRPSVDVDEAVGLLARSDGIPAGTSATFDVSDDGGAVAATLDALVGSGRVVARWTPTAPGRYRFTVRAGGCEAASPALDVDGWLEVQVVGASGASLGGASYRLTLSDGAEREGTVPASGLLRARGVPAGACRLTVLDAPESSDASTAEPAAGARSVGLGETVELEPCRRHVLVVESGFWIAQRLVDAHGQPLVEEVVLVLDEAGEEMARATTDLDGFLAARVRRHAPYVLRVVAPDDPMPATVVDEVTLRQRVDEDDDGCFHAGDDHQETDEGVED